MPPRKLLLIRHGEKQPALGPPPYGVNEAGEQDAHSLSPSGWQRAGALVPFFYKPWAAEIEIPDAMFASRVGDTPLITDGIDVSKSLRPQQTLMPLARVLAPAVVLATPYAVGEESQLAQLLKRNGNGVVLIAWEHHHIPDLASAFSPDAPAQWPDERFDDVWILTESGGGAYTFSETPQSLLSGDLVT
jgi:broad specificity phosphatase PhoE